LIVAVLLAKWVLRQDQGPEAMQKISGAIRSGAEAFLRRQNGTIVKIAVPLGLLIWVLYAFVRTATDFDPAAKMTLAAWTAGSFAARGADLFESTASENIGAMLLAATLSTPVPSLSLEQVTGVMLFPLVARAFGILASIVGIFFTKIREDQDPMTGLKRRYYL